MTRIPSKSEILSWISDNPTKTAKRDIAKAFGIKGAARIELKRLLRELQDDGKLTKRRSSYRDAEELPPVAVLQITGPDDNGDLFARPLEWKGQGAEPRILMMLRDSDPALGEGDRILARLTVDATEEHSHTGRMIRRIGTNPQRILGVFRAGSEGGRVMPIDKGSDKQWTVAAGATGGAKDGELVEAEQAGPKGRMGLPKARIVARLGDPTEPRAVSLIAIHQHGIPDHFPDEVIAEADRAKPVEANTDQMSRPVGTTGQPPTAPSRQRRAETSRHASGMTGGGFIPTRGRGLPSVECGNAERQDLRDLPLVTIDPSDARDHDDACYVETNDDGTFTIWVAIADVAHYVRPDSALDREARKRGNSTYLPDRVVPMLPDRLSGDLCSLHEGVERACLAVAMTIDANGNKISHEFHRGLMKSVASLNYEEVQRAVDGTANDKTAPLMDDILTPLYAAYAALKKARAARQPLDLDLPERQIKLDDNGKVTSVAEKERLDAHRLIEEFMVLANVAAAETLIANKSPLLFRVHEEPSPEKLEALREVAQASGLVLAKGQVLKTAHLNRLLTGAADTENQELINMATLRSMTQAYYSPDNFGHFGLALRAYAHFTSPIRRYADLIVHRALIGVHGWGDDGLSPWDIEHLPETAKQISDTERRSMMAERDTTDRYLAAFLSDRVGAELTGRVSGIAKFGLFIKLDETGADAMVPLRTLGNEYWDYDADSQTLMGSDSGMIIGLGQKAVVKLAEAAPVTGGLLVELLEIDGAAVPKGPTGRRGKPVRRKAGSAKKKAAATARKVKRRRR